MTERGLEPVPLRAEVRRAYPYPPVYTHNTNIINILPFHIFISQLRLRIACRCKKPMQISSSLGIYHH